jgi:hypothetical protein
LLRLALSLLAAFTTRLALARAAFAALALASVATSAARTFVATGLLWLCATLFVAPWFVAAAGLARHTFGTVLATRFVAQAALAATLAATASITTVATTIAATAAFAAIAVMARTITFAVLAAATDV